MNFRREVAALGTAIAKVQTALATLDQAPAQNPPRGAPTPTVQRRTLFAGPTLAKRQQQSRAALLGGGATLFKGYPEYNANQDRDESGKWTSGGGGTVSATRLRESTLNIRNTDQTFARHHLQRAVAGRFGVGTEQVNVGVFGRDITVGVHGPKSAFSFAYNKFGNGILVDWLGASNDASGQAFAVTALRFIRDFAIANDVEYISANASSSMGGYLWPYMGFDAASPAFGVRALVRQRIEALKTYLPGAFDDALWILREDQWDETGPTRIARLSTRVALPSEVPGPIAGIVNAARQMRGELTVGKLLLAGSGGAYVLTRDKLHRLVTVKRFSKGHPEYSDTQARGPDGKWVAGGGTPAVAMGPAQRLLQRSLKAHPTPTRAKFLASLTGGERAYLRRTMIRLKGKPATHYTTQDGGFRNADGTWVKQRAALHDQIIQTRLQDAMQRAKPAPGQRPHVVIIGGRPASGKTPAAKDSGFIANPSNYLYVNADDLRGDNKLFTQGDARYGLPGYAGWNSSLYHVEASLLADRLAYEARELGLNVIHDATLRKVGNARQMIGAYKQAGYRVSGVYVHAPPAVTAPRIITRAMRGSGRFVPTYILGTANNERTFDAIRGRLDEWKLYDNSTWGAYKLVARGGKARKALGKGYPEYNADQDRDESGKWTNGGGGGSSSGAREANVGGLRVFNQAGVNIDIEGNLGDVPEAHKRALAGLPIFVARDMRELRDAYTDRAGLRRHKAPGVTHGFFVHEVGLFVGAEFDGRRLAHPGKTLVHEFAHVLDYYYSNDPKREFAFTAGIADTIRDELVRLPKAVQHYAAHYINQQDWPREVFAEVYAAMYGYDDGRPRSRQAATKYMGALTRREVLGAFPKTVAAIKGMDVSNVKYRSHASASEWVDWFRDKYAKVGKGHPEYNANQERGEDGKWTGGGGTSFKVSQREAQIFLDRLAIPDTIAEALTDKLEDDEPYPHGKDDIEAAASRMEREVRATGTLTITSELDKDIIEDVVDGSTFGGGLDDLVSNGEITPQQAAAWRRTLRVLNEKLRQAGIKSTFPGS